MLNIVEQRFNDWTRGKDALAARIAIFNGIRNIPYAIIPELNDANNYVNILKQNRGSCTPKHLLLCSMYQRLKLEVVYVVYHYRWDAFNDLYPPELKELATEMPLGNHLACKVDIEGKLTLVDATLDPALGKAGLSVNYTWDGVSDTALPILPIGDEEIFHPAEATVIKEASLNKQTQTFYDGLNDWMDKLR